MTGKSDEDERIESRRILERVSHEAESGGRTVIDRATNRAKDHLTATDVDRGDWVEYWGTRIGRTIGALFLVGLIVWLVLYLAQGE
jgi:tetrahydromethanopterin S-methyltransferase subunit G